MLNIIVRIFLLVAGVIVGWFVEKDAANFNVIQGAVSILLFILFIGIVAFLPTDWMTNFFFPKALNNKNEKK